MSSSAPPPSLIDESFQPRTVGNVGFKDWSVICDALGAGVQSLILRKGGIAEGCAGFRFKHDRFFLMPTGFHQQLEKIVAERVDWSPSPGFTDTETVTIRYFFSLEFAAWIADWDKFDALRPFHIWRDETVRERFKYGDEQGLQCAFGRVYRCAPAWTFPNRPAYGGCRSWVTLPDPTPEMNFSPVIDDAAHVKLRHEVGQILGLDSNH